MTFAQYWVPLMDCPSCGAELRRATIHALRPPQPGDMAVCFECVALLVVTRSCGELSVRAMRPAEYRALDTAVRDELLEVRHALLARKRDSA